MRRKNVIQFLITITLNVKKCNISTTSDENLLPLG